MERTPNIEVLEGEMRRITVTTPIDREEMDLRMAAAKQFVENYYKTFDANRADLVNLYGEESFVVFEGQKIQGKEAIFAKNSPPFSSAGTNSPTSTASPAAHPAACSSWSPATCG